MSKDICHAEERNYTGPHVIAERSHAAGPASLCGIPFLALKEGHWITRPDSNVNCPECLSLLAANGR